MKHQSVMRVRFGELDPYNHVNHAVYVSYFESGRDEALRFAGVGLDRLGELGFQFVVTDLSVKYRVPAVAGDVLTVETWIAELRGVTSQWRQQILRGDQVLVECELRAGSTDRNGRPKRLPEEVRALLAAIMVTTDPPDLTNPA
jgi:acyl-CoA thioester hydrolase